MPSASLKFMASGVSAFLLSYLRVADTPDGVKRAETETQERKMKRENSEMCGADGERRVDLEETDSSRRK